MGWIGQLDKTKAFAYLLKWRLFGVLLIGVIFGIVSTPCASAPLVAIIALASSFDEAQAYSLVLVFTLGHCLLLLLAGVCVGFVQSVASNPLIGWITKVMTQVFALGLIAAGGYFFYQAWLQGF
jgi:cytochrome c biogenesis protein CcdA